MTNPARAPDVAAAWLAWALGALFYAYGFLLRVAPSVMVDELMRDLGVGAAALGTLSAAYFYAYAAVQVPVGVLLDRFGTRRLLILAALLAAAGAAVFSLAPGLAGATAGRAVIGVAAGFSYVGALKLAAGWFPPARFGVLVGLTLALGLAGAIAGQLPLGLVVAASGWRTAGLAVALVGLVLAVAMLIALREPPVTGPTSAARPAVAAGLIAVLRRRDLWLLVVAASAAGSPMLTFAGLWGVPFLQQTAGLERAEAALLTSSMLAAWAVGGPVLGWAGDRSGRPDRVLLVGLLGAAAAWSCAVLVQPGLVPTVLTLLVLGFCSGAMIPTFAMVRARVEAWSAGTAMGLVNTGALLSGALLQTQVGLVLDSGWEGVTQAGARIYDAAAWRLAGTGVLAVILAGCAAAAILPGTRPAAPAIPAS